MAAATTAGEEPIEDRQQDALDNDEATENSPLLPRSSSHADQSQPHREQSAENLLRRTLSDSGSDGKKKTPWRRRWPSLLALLILCLLAVLIMVFAFFAPSIVERYAQQAVVFTPTSLSIDGFTSEGVRARVQGDFTMDARRVENKAVRDLGRLGTWIARKAESGESEVTVSLPEYGNVVVGTAQIPKVVVDLRDGHTTSVDFYADVEPGDKEGIRKLANDWVEGRLGAVRVRGEVEVPLRSGIIALGKQIVRRDMVFEEGDVPKIPTYDLKKINVHEVEDGGKGGMQADVSLRVENEYPVDFVVPKLGFEILVGNCLETEPYIPVANAITSKMHVRPKEAVELNVTGLVRKLPNTLTQDCPDSDKSPLDILLGNYMRGEENTIYVRGSKTAVKDTPQWVSDLISSITVPVPLPGKTMGHLIKNFSLTDTHFNLPDPFADPNAPDAQPRISAKVRALVALPEEMNFNVSAKRVRADADVYYKGAKLGKLDLHKWQKANSTRIEGTKESGPGLLVESQVVEAPLTITNEDAFADVIQDLVFGGKSVVMHIKADVDVEVETALGGVKVRKIPAEGQVPVKPISSPQEPGHGHHNNNATTNSTLDFHKFMPKITDLQIANTTSSSLTLTALLNLTNPTNYSASIPYLDIHIVKNGSLLGHATAKHMQIGPGVNENLLVEAVYDPLTFGNATAKLVGRELLSQYISGWNTTLTLQLHAGSLPTVPKLGRALSRFPIEIPAPSLHRPSKPGDGDGDDDDGPHFIEDATMHLLTSTATFTLLSPLRHSTLVIEHLDALALYKGDEVGHIVYGIPFAVPPVDDDGNGITSPRLPVEWSLGSVGYGAVKRALGGTLKLSATADVDVRLGEFRESVWFRGREIGASVRL